MENSYIELCNLVRFDAVNQLTNVFFDDTNKQIFAVRSGGASGVVVKGPLTEDVISFCMPDRGNSVLRSIKFSPDNQVLAVQRKENAVEFIPCQGGQPQLSELITHQMKSLIYGFVWVHIRECAVISSTGIEILTIVPEKRQVRSVKSTNMSIKWFGWCSEATLLLCCTDTNALTPVLVKQKTITKLPKLDLGQSSRDVQENKTTLGQIYGTMAVLILQASQTGMMEVEVYLLNGPGLSPRKCHVLRLDHIGKFALNTVDNLIVVHHQASATSLLFDIALSGEVINGVTHHSPVTPGRSIKPFSLKLPSLSPDGRTLPCELYSTHWVLFQPDIVIDAKLGCMWHLRLCIDSLCTLVSDRLRLTEFLLQRSNGREVLLQMIHQLVDAQYNGTLLPVLETIFDKINKVYAEWVHSELQNQTALPSNAKLTNSTQRLPTATPKVLIEQSHMFTHVFEPIRKRPYAATIVMLYLQSLNRNRIAAQEDLSKMLISELIENRNFDTLRRLVSHSLLLESKTIGCFLLSFSHLDSTIWQVALDMLSKIKAIDIIVEVLLGQGKVIEALRLARNSNDGCNQISARKFLEAAHGQNDNLLFYSVYKFFQARNVKLRGNVDFLKSEQCAEFVQHYKTLYEIERDTVQ